MISVDHIFLFAETLKRSKASPEEINGILGSGCLTDLFERGVGPVDRIKLRNFLGLSPLEASGFPVWRTIKLGGFQVSSLVNDFRLARMEFGGWAIQIIARLKFPYSENTTDIDLYNISPREIGLKGRIHYSEIIEKATKLGFSECPPEVGIQLRLQYRDQRPNEWILVATKPLLDSMGHPHVLCVLRLEQPLMLGAVSCGPNDMFFSDTRFVFTRAKSPAVMLAA